MKMAEKFDNMENIEEDRLAVYKEQILPNRDLFPFLL